MEKFIKNRRLTEEGVKIVEDLIPQFAENGHPVILEWRGENGDLYYRRFSPSDDGITISRGYLQQPEIFPL